MDWKSVSKSLPGTIRKPLKLYTKQKSLANMDSGKEVPVEAPNQFSLFGISLNKSTHIFTPVILTCSFFKMFFFYREALSRRGQ